VAFAEHSLKKNLLSRGNVKKIYDYKRGSQKSAQNKILAKKENTHP
jgi:hypothetical protein